VFDLKTLSAHGFDGVIEGWVTTIVTALEDEKDKSDPLDHKLVKRLLPEFLEEIAAAEGVVAELDGVVKAASAGGEDEEEDGGGAGEDGPSEAEVKEAKGKLRDAKKKLRELKNDVVVRLKAGQKRIEGKEAEGFVLGLLEAEFRSFLQAKTAERRGAVLAAVEGWWSKYGTTLDALEHDRDAAGLRLRGYLKELGYE
jgi:type I restriction enzyme M protein